jgi:hypothetical protein
VTTQTGNRVFELAESIAGRSTSGAERMRACRRRKHERCIIVQLDITADGVRALQSSGWLSPADGSNRNAIGEAVLASASAALTKGLRPADPRGAPNGREPGV